MDQERIGKFIAELRKEKGMTQEQLAETVGVSSKTVSRWENGRNMPDYSVLEDLTGELGITVNELIRGERIVKDAIVEEYDKNLVSVLKEYKRLKRAKNIILFLLLAAAGWAFWLGLVIYLPHMISGHAKVEVSIEIEDYEDQIGPGAQKKYSRKGNMDESIFPQQITDTMQVRDYQMVYYDPWDAQYLAYLVAEYEEEAYKNELDRLKNYPSTEYKGYYGASGFTSHELLAIYADGNHGFVYALGDKGSRQIIYVEIIFCNYFMDLDYQEYIDAEYLPDGFDAAKGNAYRREVMDE